MGKTENLFIKIRNKSRVFIVPALIQIVLHFSQGEKRKSKTYRKGRTEGVGIIRWYDSTHKTPKILI